MSRRSRERAQRRAGAVALACVAVLLAASGSALAAPSWLPAADLSALGRDAALPQVAGDRQGDAVAVWERDNGANTIVQAAERTAGGVWQAPVDLSAPGQNATLPQVAVDPQGDATAVWQRSNGSNMIVQAAARPAGGVWQAAADLSAAGRDAFIPQVALDAQGNATAIWLRSNGTNYLVQAAIRPAGAIWGAPVDLSAAGQEARDPRLAVNAHGDTVAVWTRSNGANTIVQAAIRPADGAWQAPVDLSAVGQNALGPVVAIDSQGAATVVWQRSNGTNSIVQAAQLPAGGVWQAPVDLSALGQDASNPAVALDAQGAATAIWQRSNGTNGIIQSASHPVGGGWQSPIDLSVTGQNAALPQVALDPTGNAVAVWQRSDGTTDVVQGATRPAGGTWRAPLNLSVPGLNALYPQVTVDQQGDATVVWQRFSATQYVVQAAGYDAAGPQLRSALIPSSGTAGIPLSFSVSPLDVWSPVVSTSWTFGDGQSATATTVTHTYTTAGTYPVSLTSADTLANATSATASIAIAPAPAPATPAAGAPVLSNVSQSHRVWREGSKQASLARGPSRKPPIGTSFAFTLDMRARVGLAFTQPTTGRIVSGTCRALNARNRTRRRCRLTVTRGTLALIAPSGAHRIAFQGRISSTRLPRGAYTLLIVAANTSTGQRSRTQTLHFTIVR